MTKSFDDGTKAPTAHGQWKRPMLDSAICEHNSTSTTRELGPHCCDCGEPLVGMFWTISRNTPAGALLYAMRNNTSGSQKHGQ